ncbi:hypothetical protein [Xanthomonas euvesicatoria]|nr:hypothetical protein [Xanthomonas euvesicatoria]
MPVALTPPRRFQRGHESCIGISIWACGAGADVFCNAENIA